jgi:hypothetical protein
VSDGDEARGVLRMRQPTTHHGWGALGRVSPANPSNASARWPRGPAARRTPSDKRPRSTGRQDTVTPGPG